VATGARAAVVRKWRRERLVIVVNSFFRNGVRVHSRVPKIRISGKKVL
jgi:hypothetical protein